MYRGWSKPMFMLWSPSVCGRGESTCSKNDQTPAVARPSHCPAHGSEGGRVVKARGVDSMDILRAVRGGMLPRLAAGPSRGARAGVKLPAVRASTGARDRIGQARRGQATHRICLRLEEISAMK